MSKNRKIDEVRDDVQMHLDAFYDAVTFNSLKSIKELKSALRQVMVTHSSVDAADIKKIYKKLVEISLKDETWSELQSKVKKNMLE